MKKNIFSRLSFKFLIGFVVLAVVICLSTCFIGLSKYKNTIQKMYNIDAYTIADAAASYVDGNNIAGYLEKGKPDEVYDEMAQRINALRAKSQANYIYIYVPDKSGQLTYIFDAISANPGIPQKNINDTDPMNEKYKDIVLEIYRTGIRSDNYFISKSVYGDNTSAIVPVFNDKNEVTALINADVSMALVNSSIHDYLINAVVVSSLLVILIVLIYLNYLRINVIKPINLIAKSAENFVQSGNQLAEELPKIKTNDEIQFLAESLTKMQNDISNYIKNLAKVTADKERIATELNVATEIQASMLPCIFPAFPQRKDFDIYASMNPAKEVGGDFYDFFLVDDDHLCVVMADVSGKGVPAALFMVIAKTLIKDNVMSGKSPAEAFTAVNAQLCENNEANMFVTAFMTVLELSTGKFTYVNAGHNPPLIKKSDGKFEWLKAKPAFILAVMEGMLYSQEECMLEPGDIFFAYTDGVTEARSADGVLYSDPRLISTLNAVKDYEVQKLLKAVKADVDKYSEGAEQADDITMIGLKYIGN